MNIDKEPPSYNTILNILQNIRKVIAENTKEKYKNFYIGGENKNEAVDESLFVHGSEGEQIWVVGGIQTDNKSVRIDVIPTRNADNLSIFCENHINPGNNIFTDRWAGYNFIDAIVSVYTHETHDH